MSQKEFSHGRGQPSMCLHHYRTVGAQTTVCWEGHVFSSCPQWLSTYSGTKSTLNKCLSSEWCMGECEDLEIFNWKIIALQCCIGFWHMTTRISHEYTYVCSLLSLPPTPLRCCRHPAGLPASYHYTWWCLHANPNFPVCPTLSFLCCAHKSVLYIFISIPALQIGSSI